MKNREIGQNDTEKTNHFRATLIVSYIALSTFIKLEKLK